MNNRQKRTVIGALILTLLPSVASMSISVRNLALQALVVWPLAGIVLMVQRTKTQSTPPSPQELDQLVDHVAYEFAALEASANHFLRTSAWVFLETFLLHARQLREFLWGKWDPTDRHGASSVFAEHYSASWRGVRGGYPTAIAATKNTIDKQLAHITRERVDANTAQDLGAKVVPLRDEIRAAWKRFLTHLGTDPRAAAFATALSQRCNNLGVPPPP